MRDEKPSDHDAMNAQFRHLSLGPPRRLAKPPIIEALCEIRFSPAPGLPSELLPGLVYPALRGTYPTMQRLPSADLPAPLRAADPNLQYVPLVRLVGANGNVGLGDRVATVAVLAKYETWPSFRERIVQLWDVLRSNGALGTVERFSLKFVNLVEKSSTPVKELLRLNVVVGDTVFDDQPLQLVMQAARGNFVEIVQVMTKATATLQTGVVEGTILDVDIVSTCDLSSFDSKHIPLLDEAHDIAKQVFLGAVTDKALQQWGAIYE